ncbi:MAG: hypothetical protein JXA49_09680 [Actinobacteria bacterium]|nr:hypothetical protein [Actinomycetota bacterium]
MEEQSGSTDRMASFGAMATSLIGIILGMSIVILGSFLTWQSDEVLGIFNRSGWAFNNVINGDGRITFILGIVCLIFLALGWLLKSRVSYGVAALLSFFFLAFSIYELAVINYRSSLLGTGLGIYLLGLGGVIGFLSSLCGVFIVKGEYTGPQMNIP